MNITQEGNEQRDQFAQGLDLESYKLKHRKVKITIAFQPRLTSLWQLGIIYQYPSSVVNQRIFSYPHNLATTYCTNNVDTIKILQETKL